jgi:hypothetical protein
VLAQEPREVVRLPAIADEKELHQVDSTVPMLDWFKQASRSPTSNAGIWHLYKQQYEAQQAGQQTARPEPLSVMVKRLGILRPL